FRAIEYETKRQIEVLEGGGSIQMETRGFDAVKGITISQRSKEMAHDYRYFPEPDLQAIFVKEDYIKNIENSLPPLPNELLNRYISELQLSAYDAEMITEDKAFALYYEELTKHTENYKAAANWMMGAVKSHLNENALNIEAFSLQPKTIAEIIALIDEGAISNSIANQKVFPALLEKPKPTARQIAETNNWIQESNTDTIDQFIENAIAKFPEKVVEYRNGKTGLMGLFMGEVMKASKGKADPKMTSKLLKEKLEQ
ncbi:MAG: Asp-tRNA(Asn)/Glu-tRNA(Gln) amidotransferase GatCAB subunit B, partial [Vicingaceae bacterium]